MLAEDGRRSRSVIRAVDPRADRSPTLSLGRSLIGGLPANADWPDLRGLVYLASVAWSWRATESAR